MYIETFKSGVIIFISIKRHNVTSYRQMFSSIRVSPMIPTLSLSEIKEKTVQITDTTDFLCDSFNQNTQLQNFILDEQDRQKMMVSTAALYTTLDQHLKPL